MFTRTLKVFLELPVEQVAAVRDTGREMAQVYAKHVDWALSNKTLAKQKAHAELYAAVRKAHPTVPSALVQATRDMALENLKAIHSRHPKRKWHIRPEKSEYSSIRFDARTVTLRGQQLSFSTVAKRVRTVIQVPAWFEQRYPERKFTAATIRYDKRARRVVANLIFSIKAQAQPTRGTVLGLDRGLYQLVTTSEGIHHSGAKVRALRREHVHLRQKLQQKGTRSAKQLLKKRSGKEKRFMLDVNHCITKQLVQNSAHSTFVLERLTGIRDKRRGKTMNTWLGQWAFHQFEILLDYKASALGKQVVFIDPRYTSQRCNACGRIEKSNRKKNRYVCKHCGFIEHADVNAALNIRDLHILSLSP